RLTLCSKTTTPLCGCAAWSARLMAARFSGLRVAHPEPKVNVWAGSWQNNCWPWAPTRYWLKSMAIPRPEGQLPLPGLKGRRILICRPEPEASRLATAFRAAGAECRTMPLLAREPLPETPERRTVLQELDNFQRSEERRVGKEHRCRGANQ